MFETRSHVGFGLEIWPHVWQGHIHGVCTVSDRAKASKYTMHYPYVYIAKQQAKVGTIDYEHIIEDFISNIMQHKYYS
jgi:hypothetical protein